MGVQCVYLILLIGWVFLDGRGIFSSFPMSYSGLCILVMHLGVPVVFLLGPINLFIFCLPIKNRKKGLVWKILMTKLASLVGI